MRKIVDLYFELEKRIQILLELLVNKEVEKFNRDFYVKNKISPTEHEIQNIKKIVVMKKGLYAFSILLLTIFLVIGYRT